LIFLFNYLKAVLDAALRPGAPMTTALKLAFLAFEPTRLASGDVGYPLDVLTFGPDRLWREREFAEEELWVLRRWWEVSLPRLIDTMPEALRLNELLPQAAERAAPVGAQARAARPATLQAAAKNGRSSQST
jgi:putative proteasome-type protease